MVKSRAACSEKVVPSCNNGIYCKNLSKDSNGCPGADFCAASAAGTYIFINSEWLFNISNYIEIYFDFTEILLVGFTRFNLRLGRKLTY